MVFFKFKDIEFLTKLYTVVTVVALNRKSREQVIVKVLNGDDFVDDGTRKEF